MPWNIILIPALLCLVLGFREGLKMKNKKYGRRG